VLSVVNVPESTMARESEAVLKGTDVDQPRNLAKSVTMERKPRSSHAS